MEIWKEVKGFENYKVSNLGNVKSYKLGNAHSLKQNKNKKGYLMVTLYGEIRKTFTVHRLVLSNFSKLEIDKQINHINGVKTDNRIENLEWCTNIENQKHAFENGLLDSKMGVKNFWAKLTNEQVLDIKRKGKYSTWKKIGQDYAVSDTTIRRIINNKKWKHILNE
jgi:hypothetical protein